MRRAFPGDAIGAVGVGAGRGMAFDLKIRPNRLPWPPVLFALAVLAALFAQYIQPRTLGVDAPARLPGVVILLAGLALTGWAIQTMRTAHTNIAPHRAADKLVTSGPFAISRNPIYLGVTIAMLGLAGVLNSLWMVLAAFSAAALVSALAIRREEGHLALRFGSAWTSYCARTPRWISADSFGRRRKA